MAKEIDSYAAGLAEERRALEARVAALTATDPKDERIKAYEDRISQVDAQMKPKRGRVNGEKRPASDATETPETK